MKTIPYFCTTNSLGEIMKTYVLDTNVILASPDAIYAFGDNTVILPLTILDELDKFKKETNELGRNARQVARNLDALREIGDLSVGVKLPSGGTLRVVVALSRTLLRLPYDLDENVPDNRILSVAIDCSAILVTRDINLRIKADAVGVKAEDYKHSSVAVDEFYTGTSKGYISGDCLGAIYTDKKLSIDSVTLPLGMGCPYPNQYFTLYSMDNEKQAALTRYDNIAKEFVLISDEKIMGIGTKNSEQQFALDALMNEHIPLVTMTGCAGTGKTLYALLAGLHQVLETKQYKKLMILKPIIAMNNSNQIGFLKGSFMEKMAPWVASYSDNVDVIMGADKKETDRKPKAKGKKNYHEDDEKYAGAVSMMEELISYGLLEVGSLESMRGRSLSNMYIILDEIQSCSKELAKSVVTRLGEGSKAVLLGDQDQIDVPWLDSSSNGLTHVIENFKGEQLAAHVHLTKSVRSAIAERAAALL